MSAWPEWLAPLIDQPTRALRDLVAQKSTTDEIRKAALYEIARREDGQNRLTRILKSLGG